MLTNDIRDHFRKIVVELLGGLEALEAVLRKKQQTFVQKRFKN